MLNDWVFWLSSLHIDECWVILTGLLLVDAPRYSLVAFVAVMIDVIRLVFRSKRNSADRYTPSISVLLVGHNEASTIRATLESIWNSYPKLQIIVVDDGSTDGMADYAREFQSRHAGILLLSRSERGGKSSGLNWALGHATAEVVVTIDADSRLEPGALERIVAPLADPRVGAVSASLLVWNADHNLVTRLQQYEYRQTIFLGRLIQSKLGMLGIVSGAFGAFRRSALEQIKGWDVGPGEDGDAILRLRRSGYRIAAAPDAHCYTNVPTKLGTLFKQRRRWDRTVVTFEVCKHASLASLRDRSFRLSDFVLTMERYFFNIACLFGFWAYTIWILQRWDHHVPFVLGAIYILQTFFEFVQFLCLLWFSPRPLQDLKLIWLVPLMVVYHAFLKIVDVVAVLEELLFRMSRHDTFVPEKVRRATWKW